MLFRSAAKTFTKMHPGSRTCFICESPAHIARNCPKKVSRPYHSTTLSCQEVNPTECVVRLANGVTVPCKMDEDGVRRLVTDNIIVKQALNVTCLDNLPVQWGKVKDWDGDVEVLRDTGCTGIVVREGLCGPDTFTGETQTCMLMDGSLITKPVVSICIDTPYLKGKVRAIAMEHPVYDVVVGNFPGARAPDDPDQSWTPDDDMIGGTVVTRQQAKVKKLSPLKVAKSPELKATRFEVRKMQIGDPSLGRIKTWIDKGMGENPRKGCKEEYYWDQETQLLMRKYTTTPAKGSREYTQLVLPSKLRGGVLEVAHDSILGGHLGTQKTLDRVLSNFYWMGIHDDVTRYCQSCDTCQRTAPKGRSGKAPLGTMPITGIPFSRVAMDLIGPLPASGRGHRWALTLVDCATRYPEAVPLKGIETTDIAEELVGIFSRVGIPEQILTEIGREHV